MAFNGCDAVAAESGGKALTDVVADLPAQQSYVLSRESLKTVPRGYDREHPRADLLRHKGVATG